MRRGVADEDLAAECRLGVLAVLLERCAKPPDPDAGEVELVDDESSRQHVASPAFAADVEARLAGALETCAHGALVRPGRQRPPGRRRQLHAPDPTGVRVDADVDLAHAALPLEGRVGHVGEAALLTLPDDVAGLAVQLQVPVLGWWWQRRCRRNWDTDPHLPVDG